MDAPLTIEREIDVDMSAAELWDLIATGDGWQQWMVDAASIRVAPGSEGTVVDDGVRRAVRVHEMVQGCSVSFHWSEVGSADDLSLVTLQVVERPDGRVRLRVTEQWLSPLACADCPLRAGDRWALRECVLCLTAAATCPV